MPFSFFYQSTSAEHRLTASLYIVALSVLMATHAVSTVTLFNADVVCPPEFDCGLWIWFEEGKFWGSTTHCNPSWGWRFWGRPLLPHVGHGLGAFFLCLLCTSWLSASEFGVIVLHEEGEVFGVDGSSPNDGLERASALKVPCERVHALHCYIFYSAIANDINKWQLKVISATRNLSC